jgi:predicted amidohydrolase YtcJ
MIEVADLIITNANVITLDTQHPCVWGVAIKDGRFLALLMDSNDEVRFRGHNTTIIDAHGRTVIPGLNDSHLHIIREGLNYNLEVRWDNLGSVKDALDLLKYQATKTQPGQWIRVVGGWSAYQFKEKRMPTIDEINEISSDIPVFVMHLYERVLLNKAALKALGNVTETLNLPGSLIEKDSLGNPSGVLLAYPSAAILYSALAQAPKLSYQEQVVSTQNFLHEMNRLGVTSAIDAGGGFQEYPENYEVMSGLAQQKKLTVRIAYNLFTQHPGHELEDFTKWTQENTPAQGDDFYRLNGAGEMLVYTAADYENFLQVRPDLPETMEIQLTEVIRLLVKARWPFRLHATYNESITRFLNVFEAVDREIPFHGLRWFFDHAETISSENLDRVKALGGGISIQDRMAFQGEDFIQRYGAQAAAYAPPITTMLKKGIPVGAGTDATRVASYNPWISLYWLVTGKTVGGKQLYGPDNLLTREKALELWTAGSAWFSGDQEKKGRIQPGKFADLVILSKDYFSIPEEEIKSLESVFTIVGGKIVYTSN